MFKADLPGDSSQPGFYMQLLVTVLGFSELDLCSKSKVTLTQPQLSHIKTLIQSLCIFFFFTKTFLIYFPIILRTIKYLFENHEQIKPHTQQIHIPKLNELVKDTSTLPIKDGFPQMNQAGQEEAALYSHVYGPFRNPLLHSALYRKAMSQEALKLRAGTVSNSWRA